MSARKATRRPKARNEKLIEVRDGHKLTPEQHSEYLRYLNQIQRQFPTWKSWDHEQRALSDCLFRWRPSVKAEKRFKESDLYRRTQAALFTLGHMKDFPMAIGGAGTVRIGNDLIKHIADELDAVSGELRKIHSAIAQEAQS